MIWGIKDNQRIKASPNLENVRCEICRNDLIAKCGSIKIWHFAHKVSADCDSWSEEETQWHKEWKNEFPNESQEVIIECHHSGIKHRADIQLPNQEVIELQNSPISSEDIQKREEFYCGDPNDYKGMIWLLNGNKFCKGLNLREKGKYDNYINGIRRRPQPIQRLYENQIVTFRWKNPPKSWWYANKKIYIHLIGQIGECKLSGGFILEIKEIHQNIPCGGWGIIISKEEFLKRFKDGARTN